MKRLAFLLPIALLAALGCHAQYPTATNNAVQITWSIPVAANGWPGCSTAAPCGVVISRCTTSPAACIATNSASWVQLNGTTPATGTSYIDATSQGLTAYYLAVLIQTGTDPGISGPSSVVGPFVVPANPLAPSLAQPTVTTAALIKPALPVASQGSIQMAAIHLTATLIARR